MPNSLAVPLHGPGNDGNNNPSHGPQMNQRDIESVMIRGSRVHRLNFDMINRMGPHELDNFVLSLMRAWLTDDDVRRISQDDKHRMIERQNLFRSLAPDHVRREIGRRSFYYPGYNDDDSLDIAEINIMTPQELANLREIMIVNEEFERISPQAVERFHERAEDIQLGDLPSNGGVAGLATRRAGEPPAVLPSNTVPPRRPNGGGAGPATRGAGPAVRGAGSTRGAVGQERSRAVRNWQGVNSQHTDSARQRQQFERNGSAGAGRR